MEYMGISSMEVPQNGWFIGENPNLKWMITRGTPVFWKPKNKIHKNYPLKNPILNHMKIHTILGVYPISGNLHMQIPLILTGMISRYVDRVNLYNHRSCQRTASVRSQAHLKRMSILGGSSQLVVNPSCKWNNQVGWTTKYPFHEFLEPFFLAKARRFLRGVKP